MDYKQKCHKSTKVAPAPSDINTDKLCRICYEREIYKKWPSYKLLAPCKCKGTIQYIHYKCLKDWIKYRECDTQMRRICEICNSRFIFNSRNRYKNPPLKKFCKLLCCLRITYRVHVAE